MRRGLGMAMAVAYTGAALALALLFHPVLAAYSALLFILAVAASAATAGVWPGLLAALLSSVALNFWFFPAAHAFGFATPIHLVQQAVFWTTAALIAVIVAERRNRRRAAEERTRRVEAAGAGTWEWNLETNLLTLSRGAAEIHRLPPDRELEIGALLDTIHAVDHERVRAALGRSASEGRDYAIEYRVPHHGSIRVAVAVGRVVEAGDGASRRMVGVVVLLPEPDRLADFPSAP